MYCFIAGTPCTASKQLTTKVLLGVRRQAHANPSRAGRGGCQQCDPPFVAVIHSLSALRCQPLSAHDGYRSQSNGTRADGQ